MFPSSNPAQSAKDLKAMIGFDVLHKDKLGEGAMCTHPDWSTLGGWGAGGVERLGIKFPHKERWRVRMRGFSRLQDGRRGGRVDSQ